MKLNSIYTTFQGECNPFGIGHPAIFLRLQGCHLRCYKKTMGILCDTPEGLRKSTEKDDIAGIVMQVVELANKTGIRVVTLTGGDPLWNNQEEVIELLKGLTMARLDVCVETSGTLSWLPYTRITYPNIKVGSIYWVVDYKLASAGVKNVDKLFLDTDHLLDLTEKDFIKFVVADELDLEECIKKIKALEYKTLASISVGNFWGGRVSTFDIFERLKKENLLGRTTINAQLHKLVIAPNINSKIPKNI